jgi:parvulin-like peptidyl-prolyl isomerase
MVMSAMREKTKVVLFIALIAFVGFIFFDWGMQKGQSGSRGDAGVIGEVNGREIPYEDYRRTRQEVIAEFEARTGRSPEYADFDTIEEETWISLIRESLLQAEIQKYGIVVTDAEIMEVLRRNPPEIIRSLPDFADSAGQFDPVRYSQALANPAFNWIPVENYLRATMPRDKLQNYVGLNARVTNAEVRERFQALNEMVKVRYVRASPTEIELEEGEVTEDELLAYYNDHPDDFLAGEQAILEYVRIPKTPTAEDTADARADLEDIRAQILEGADFANTASAWSDDPSAARGGDLGFIARGDMTPEFEDVAFSTPVGEISEVFQTPFGLHILKVEEREDGDEGERVHVRHLMIRLEASNATLREVERRMDDFLFSLEEEIDFAAAAAAAGLEVQRTEPFEKVGIIPGIGLLRGAQRFAFSQTPGTPFRSSRARTTKASTRSVSRNGSRPDRSRSRRSAIGSRRSWERRGAARGPASGSRRR